jgi:hypothetical protein
MTVALLVTLLMAPGVDEPSVTEIASVASEMPSGDERAGVYLQLASLTAAEAPVDAGRFLVRAVGEIDALTLDRKHMINRTLTTLGAQAIAPAAPTAVWREGAELGALSAVMRAQPREGLVLAADLDVPRDVVIGLMADTAIALAASEDPSAEPSGPGSIRPLATGDARSSNDPLADRAKLAEIALDLAADLTATDAATAEMASAIADALTVEPSERPDLGLPTDPARRRSHAARLAADLAEALVTAGSPVAGRAELLRDLLQAPPTLVLQPEEPDTDEAGEPETTPQTAAAELAWDAKERLGKVSAPEPLLVDRVVAALFAADPDRAGQLIYEVGPTREPACKLLCMRARTAGEALEAASGIADVGRRAEALLARAEAAESTEVKQELVGETLLLAELVQSPSEQARLLARIAAMPGSGADPMELAEKARFAAVSTPNFDARARSLAQVASMIAPVAPSIADECMDAALELTQRGLRDAQRASLLKDMAIAAAPGMPHRALEIVDDLGAGRQRSQIDALLAVTTTPHEAYQVEAINRLLVLLDEWDTAPLQKMRVLRDIPGDPWTPPQTLAPQAMPTPLATAGAILIAQPYTRPPDLEQDDDPWVRSTDPDDKDGQDHSPRVTGHAAPPPPATTTEAPEETALPDSPAMPKAEPGSREEAQRRIQWWIAKMTLERARALPTGEERIATFLEAAEALAPFDTELAGQAVSGAFAEAALYDAALGWTQIACDTASLAGLNPVALAAEVEDPKARARSLVVAGGSPEEAIPEIEDPWARAAIRVAMADAAPTGEKLDQAAAALRTLPPGDLRDDRVLSLLESAQDAGLPAALATAERLALLASEPAVSAHIRLMGAQMAGTAGNLDLAKEWLAMAEELMGLSGRTSALRAEMAVALDLVGEDGLTVARSIDSPRLRASALLRIRLQRAAAQQMEEGQPSSAGGGGGSSSVGSAA